MAENETLPLRSKMNGATAHVKAEESGWLLDRGASPLDGQLVCCVVAAVLVTSLHLQCCDSGMICNRLFLETEGYTRVRGF